MTAQHCHRSMSLVERKKQQWAREREELASLGVQFRQYNNSFEKTCDRSQHDSKPSLSQKESPSEHYHPAQERRSSLPPLYKNQYNSNYEYKNEKPDKADRGGETSGYGSDNYPTPEYKNQGLPPASNHSQWSSVQQHQSGYESSSSYRDDRPKWGDKGVGVGKFWQPKEEVYDKPANEPPNWVKRGLEADGAIVVANSSPSVSPEQRYEENDRPCTGSSFSQHRTYIRGQNIPIDSTELAERERRRQLALAHQEAIRQQLEEREKMREEERIRRIREEREEELRIEREQEHERQRKLEEERLRYEKLERDRKRKEAIKEAVENAEKEARLEKMRLKMMKQNSNSRIIDNNIAENVAEKQKIPISPICEEATAINNNEQLNNTRDVISMQKNDNIKKEVNNNLTQQQQPNLPNPANSPTRSTTSLPNSVISNQSYQLNNERSLTPIMQSPRSNNANNFTPRGDQFTYLFQPSLEGFQNFQYAVLIPASTPHYPIAIPVPLPPQTERNNILNSARTENRVLTPTRYRNNISKCDSSTQTDNTFNSARSSSETGESREKYLREKMTNLELNCENKRGERRSRSESMDERPKWGVNRPPTRYLKQSEKDPLYQRRKLRQKRGSVSKSYDEKNSSDDSQATTPVRYRKKGISDKRHSRALWRAEEKIFDGNVKMYQREIVPLETDKDQLYFKCCCNCRCQRHRCSENVRVDILEIAENSPREEQDNIRRMKREHSLPEFELTNPPSASGHKVDIIGKLSSLHNGLLLEQEKWENSPRSPSL